ncbi:MAG: glycosyltransferase family 2 protein [Candidatus Nomurabacteria bacterium]|jgi:glycosyltransferase involved in cell wall biosynthesis|nr:glycosyltransferase family 2 protein [Candidatus Nomurabacteria bacterium]
MSKSITVLIPTYNEESVLPDLFNRLNKLSASLPKYNWQFLFVNDGSRDKSLQLIKKQAETNKQIHYIDLSRNYGQEIAIMAGIDHTDTDALVIIDADLQDPPELIPKMIEIWESGFDDVYARRVSRAGESWLKKLTSWGFYRVLQKSTHVPIQRDVGNFRLFDKKCIEALQQVRETNRYNRALFSWIGYQKQEIEYHRAPRAAGKTKWNYRQLINLAIDGITSFTTTPLRISAVIGFLISLGTIIYIIVIILQTIFNINYQPGYPSMMATILFLGGVQLLSLGIIGEYIGRIFTETKNRPLYFIQEKK